jgi:hypothetical protein
VGRLVRAVAVASAAALGALVAGGAPAVAVRGGDFSLRPVRAEDAPPRQRFYIVRTVEPGAQVGDRLVAENLTGAPLDLVVEAVDAVVNADGAFAPLAPGRRSGAGAWIDVPAGTLHLDPHGSATVPIVIRVPPGAAPGEHFAAVTVRRPLRVAGTGGIAVAERVAVRVYLTVGGAAVPAEPAFDIAGFRFTGTGVAPAFDVDVANAGTVAVEPFGAVALDGPRRLRTELPVLGTVPAGERRTLRFALPGTLPPGRYRAALTLRPLAGGTERHATTAFAVAATGERAAVGRAGPPPPRGPAPGAAVAVAAVLLAVAASLLAAATGRRREGRRQA